VFAVFSVFLRVSAASAQINAFKDLLMFLLLATAVIFGAVW